jgi:hypothetical protein
MIRHAQRCDFVASRSFGGEIRSPDALITKNRDFPATFLPCAIFLLFPDALNSNPFELTVINRRMLFPLSTELGSHALAARLLHFIAIWNPALLRDLVEPGSAEAQCCYGTSLLDRNPVKGAAFLRRLVPLSIALVVSGATTTEIYECFRGNLDGVQTV